MVEKRFRRFQVSIAICNLHAMAEGARLTLLYVDNQRHDDLLALLVPILSGVAWNVLTRIGCLDSWLHFISRGVRCLGDFQGLTNETNGFKAKKTTFVGHFFLVGIHNAV